ncbi:MAG: AAA family ATPase [Pseudomonadota bacterium]
MTVNAMTVTAGQALDVLKAGWAAQCQAGQPASWMLHGRPGIGKTQLVESLAKHVNGRLYDVRLTQIDPSDLRGLPYYDHEQRRTCWYRPEDLPEDDAPAVLFLDEITAASPLLQPTVYGLLQERRVGQHAIPASTMIVAAGNMVEDGAVAYEMGTALADRLIHMVVRAEAQDWIEGFALPRSLHPAVTAFVKARPDLLETLEASMTADQMIAATPRSWERVSWIMENISDRSLRAVMVAGTVGQAVAADFLPVADDIAATVRVDEMIALDREARLPLYPVTLHALNALVFGLVGYVNDRNLEPVVETLLDIAELAGRHPDPAPLRSLPLAEMTTAGFEALIGRALDLGLADRLITHPAYLAHTKRRAALGLV